MTKDNLRIEKQIKIGLALSSGGAKGIAHISLIKGLEENNIKLNSISGSSIGSIIGAFYAIGYTGKEMSEIAESIKKEDIKKIFSRTIPLRSLLKNNGVRNFLNKYFKNKRFEDLKINFSIVTTNLNTGESIIINKGYLVDAIMSSIAIPGVFEPVKRNHQVFVDGGVSTPILLSPLKDECDFIIASVIRQKDKGFVHSDSFVNRIPFLDVSLKSASIMQDYLMINYLNLEKPDFIFDFININDFDLLSFDQSSLILKEAQKYVNIRMNDLLKKLNF